MQSGSQSRPKRMTTSRSSSDMMAWSTCQPLTRWGRTTEPMLAKVCYGVWCIDYKYRSNKFVLTLSALRRQKTWSGLVLGGSEPHACPLTPMSYFLCLIISQILVQPQYKYGIDGIKTSQYNGSSLTSKPASGAIHVLQYHISLNQSLKGLYVQCNVIWAF